MLYPQHLDTQSTQYLTYLDKKDEQIRFCNFRRLTMERYRLALEAELPRLYALPPKH